MVVDDDARFASSIARLLSEHGYEALIAHSIDEARDSLHKAPVDVLLVDLRVDDGDGIGLIDGLEGARSTARAILMSAYASARDYDAALRSGALRVLTKPFTTAELLEAIRLAADCDSGLRGSLHGLTLVDVLQMFHFARRSVSVTLDSGRAGTVVLVDGEIVHAEMAGTIGEDALRCVLRTARSTFQTNAAPLTVVRTVDRPFHDAILDAVRQNDERSASGELRLSTFTLTPPGAQRSEPPPAVGEPALSLHTDLQGLSNEDQSSLAEALAALRATVIRWTGQQTPLVLEHVAGAVALVAAFGPDDTKLTAHYIRDRGEIPWFRANVTSPARASLGVAGDLNEERKHGKNR